MLIKFLRYIYLSDSVDKFASVPVTLLPLLLGLFFYSVVFYEGGDKLVYVVTIFIVLVVDLFFLNLIFRYVKDDV